MIFYSKGRKSISLALAILMLITTFFGGFQVKDAIGAELTLEEYEEIIGSYSIDNSVLSYDEYLAKVGEVSYPTNKITIPATDYTRFTNGDTKGDEPAKYTDPKLDKNEAGEENKAVLSEENGLIEYEVDVKEAGLYHLSLKYLQVEGNSSEIQRAFFIDGELPYEELATVSFHRVWVNSNSKKYINDSGIEVIAWEKDNQGNDLKPTQEEKPEWTNSYCYDSEGYETEELCVYLTPGKHTLTLVSIKEPMLLEEIVLSNEVKTISYEERLKEWNEKGAKDTSGQMIRIEAENSSKTSSQMVYPIQDQSSPSVYPSSSKELLNNTIGGNSWKSVRQWIEWDFEVEETGFYNISLFAKQNFVKGIYVSRKIAIDNEVLFDDLSDYGFTYKQNWRLETLENKDGEAFKIYLEKGHHTFRMEAVLGEFSNIISDVQESLTLLNDIYRDIIRIIGVAPDEFRDYEIEKNIPNLEGELIEVRDILDGAIKELQRVAGKASDKETVLITMRDQLDELIKDQERFSKVLGSYKTNVRACGTWITQVREQPLQLDTIYIHSPEENIKVKKNNFWYRFAYEIQRLVYSFFIDYNQIGNVSEKDADIETLTLWIGTGRDQANVIKALIDKTFVNQKFETINGVSVNVMLVDMGTLLQASLAGQGPDIAIQVANDLPMNYGLRNAVADLSQFEDLEDIKSRFTPSAMEAFEYEDATYALPETQQFLMMFYRKDIMKELEMEVPTTWDEVKVAMAKLSQNYMEFGMIPSDQVFSMLLYQNGGSYYKDNAMLSNLDSEEGILAFKKYCEFYTDYKLDKETSVDQRFRTGEAPLIIADYTTYNNLQVSAPDIQGLWGIAPIPGTVQEDGSVNYELGCTGTACVIMEKSKHKEAAWEFLKWWTSTETQTNYGREMESLMGPAARVATANLEAFEQLAWNTVDKKALLKQFESVRGVPQVPGGYFTWRCVNNAFYAVTTKTDSATPREELTEQVNSINEEIRYKRIEFGMPYVKSNFK